MALLSSDTTKRAGALLELGFARALWSSRAMEWLVERSWDLFLSGLTKALLLLGATDLGADLLGPALGWGEILYVVCAATMGGRVTLTSCEGV